MNWETEEVINWLINDEGSYTTLHGRQARTIERYVREGSAPQGLYDSLKREPKFSLDDVDWDEVVDSLQ